jgi:hypothetical protein
MADTNPTDAIQVGTIVYGFCNGVFGRDSFEDKEVIARGEHAGQPWAVLAVTEDSWSGKPGTLYMASGAFDFELMAANLSPETEV